MRSCPHDKRIAPAHVTDVIMRGRNSSFLRGPNQCRKTQYTWTRRTKVKQVACSRDRLHGDRFGEVGKEEGAGCELSLSLSCGSVSVGAGVTAAVLLSSELARGDKEGGNLQERDIDHKL